MSKSKFEINDRVRAIRGWYSGQVGCIDRKTKNGDRYWYHVVFYKDGKRIGDCNYPACSLEKWEVISKGLPIQMVEFRPQDKVQVKDERKDTLLGTVLKTTYERACKAYLELFCKKHHLSLNPYAWVGDDVGGVANIEDLSVSFSDIRYDIDNNIPVPDFQKWYDKSLEIYELTGEHYMNYQSYCKGAPDNWSNEKLQKIRESKKRIAELQRSLEDEIQQYIKDSANPKAKLTNPMVGHF